MSGFIVLLVFWGLFKYFEGLSAERKVPPKRFIPRRVRYTAPPPRKRTDEELFHPGYYPGKYVDLVTLYLGHDPRPNRYLQALEEVGVAVTEPAKVFFKDYEPQTFSAFSGQQHVIKPLEAAVRALGPQERVIKHRLLTGLPGRGKTLIAKVLAHELITRCEALNLAPLAYVETFAANLQNVEDFDQFAQQLLEAGGGIWFIDEIHVLNKELATKLYLLMEEGRYPFQGKASSTPIPDVVVLGATTDYGMLHGALKRRFGEALMVRGMDKDELFGVVKRSKFEIADRAATMIVERTHWSGAPWEAVWMVQEAVTFAKANKASAVDLEHVQEVFDTYEIDQLGLRWYDREVLRALFRRPRYRGKAQEFVCFAASEGDLCSVVGLDPEEYRTAVKPRLLSRGLLEIKAGYGQALTTAATQHPLLAQLKS